MRAYFATVSESVSDYGAALNRLTEQSRLASRRPSLMFDTDWKMETAMVLVDMNAAARQLGGMSQVPPEAQEVDRLLKQIAAETPLLTDEYARGGDAVDAGLITSASERMKRINGWAQEINVEMQ